MSARLRLNCITSVNELFGEMKGVMTKILLVMVVVLVNIFRFSERLK
jgi:hypothetical protein